MATQVRISTYQAGACDDASTEVVASDASAQASPVIAHSVEFVALPGRAQGIQSEIPMAMRHAFRDTDGFVGSIVLVSEQEARLVTVVTLWTGLHREELRTQSEARVRRWLAPYVDRWLRGRRFTSFVTAPANFLSTSHSGQTHSSSQLQ